MFFLVGATAFLVASGEPLWHSSSSYGTATPAEATLQRAVGTSLVGLGSKKCFLPPGIGVHPNANVLLDVRELAAYDPMLPRADFESWTAVSGKKIDTAGYPFISTYCPGISTVALARVYGVGYVLEPHKVKGPKGAIFDRRIGNERLYRIPDTGEATLSPIPSSGRLPAITAPGTVLPVIHPDPAAWKLVTDGAGGPQVLRLRLTDVPGWHASIDGRPLPLTTFAGVMLQARVPPGRHTIELHYWPATFTSGIVLAAIAAVGLVVALVVDGLRRRRASTSA